MKTVNIIGNGPSSCLYSKKLTNDEVSIGCNFALKTSDIDYTCIIDLTPIKSSLTNENLTIAFPAIVSERTKTYIEKKNAKVQIHDVMPLYFDKSISKNLPANSGHHATIWALETYPDCKSVLLWGMDSLWKDSIHSTTNKMINKSVNLNMKNIRKYWLQYWFHIFDKYKEVDFSIVIPESHKNIKYLRDNVFYVYR